MPKSKAVAASLGPLTISEQPLDSGAVAKVKSTRKPPVVDPSAMGLGSSAYLDSTLAGWFAQPLNKKQELGRNTWANTALVLSLRAKRAAQTYGKKDFNSLYRLVLSAGIAFDKAFPSQIAPLQGNLVIQLFGGLGSDVARRILEPSKPNIVVDITPNPLATPTYVEEVATATDDLSEIPLEDDVEK